jgi:hypothetical protein
LGLPRGLLFAGAILDRTAEAGQRAGPGLWSVSLHILQLQRQESNFVYDNYKLIVELFYDAHWFWDASKNAHETTSNLVTLSKSN